MITSLFVSRSLGVSLLSLVIAAHREEQLYLLFVLPSITSTCVCCNKTFLYFMLTLWSTGAAFLSLHAGVPRL